MALAWLLAFILWSAVAVSAGAVVFGILIAFFTIQDTRHALEDESWFVTTPLAALPLLEQHIQLDSRSVVYDLGCGDGRILSFLHARHPEASYVGIEDNFVLFWLASVKNILRRSPRFVLKRGDFFAEPLERATHVIAYLPAITIDRIYKKLQRELVPGAVFATFDVPLPMVRPTAMVHSPTIPTDAGRCGKVYIYTL